MIVIKNGEWKRKLAVYAENERNFIIRFQESTESYFLGIFTVEASLKILAQGLFEKCILCQPIWCIVNLISVDAKCRLRVTPRELPEKYVEHHGFRRRRNWVSHDIE